MEWTIQEALGWGRQKLKQKNIDSFHLDARLLLKSSMGISLEEMVAHPEYRLTKQQMSVFQEYINRRRSYEPVSRILKQREFWGRDFTISPATLDPRSDSETMIETVKEYFDDSLMSLNILEFGVGSGCLLLSVLSEYPYGRGIGVDLSYEALKVSDLNAARYSLTKRVSWINGDWGKALKGSFDLILSNPPYIPSQTIDELAADVRNFDPRLALDGGINGLDCYDKLRFDCKRLLKQNGYLMVEIGWGQEREVETLFEEAGLKAVAWRKDLSGILRCGVFQHEVTR